ncbi:MAG: hypothetical protein AABZ30_10210 [Myxococcota bacterium]
MRWGLSLTCALALGCGDEVGIASAPAASVRELGFVDLTQTQGGLRTRAVFARFHDMEAADASRLLGLEDDGWAASAVEDSCLSIDPTEALDAALPLDAVSLELLEVGPLAVRVASERTLLTAQPLVLPFAAGVVYEGETRWLPEEEYVLEVDQVGRFAMQAPPDARMETPPTLVPGRDLLVRWEPSERRDLLFWVEVGWVRHGRSRLVRCATADDGAFAVPGALLLDAAESRVAPTAAIVRVKHAETPEGWRVRFASRGSAAIEVESAPR